MPFLYRMVLSTHFPLHNTPRITPCKKPRDQTGSGLRKGVSEFRVWVDEYFEDWRVPSCVLLQGKNPQANRTANKQARTYTTYF